jgi:hypothetical protein
MSERLADVLSLFVERYRLQDTDESAGRDAIKAAMRGDLPIAELRRILTEDYELYPQYRGRVLAILDAIAAEVPASNGDEAPPPPEEPATDDVVKSISRMNKGELVALAAEREIEVAEDATVADLREALAE